MEILESKRKKGNMNLINPSSMDRERFIESITPKPYLKDTEYDFKKRYESFEIIANIMVPGFIIDDSNRDLYENAIKYFAGDKSSKFDLDKGIYLYGKVGVGKSMFFKIFHKLNTATDNPNNFNILTISKLVSEFAKFGFDSFKEYELGGDWHYGCHWLLDDLGQSASSVKHFGSSTNIVAEFIQRRYNIYTDYYKLTHISTNMEPQEIKDEYGEFIASRMREMFNIVLFNGSDRRK